MKVSCTFFIIAIICQTMQAQTTIPLYDGPIPNAKKYDVKEDWEASENGDTTVHYTSAPTLTIFLPEGNTTATSGVVICPGGGYWVTSIVKEGFAVAREFAKNGIAAFVLKYRLPDDSAVDNKEIVPLQDAQRAIQLVRLNAKKWHVDPDKVGILGFSAGGHLASTASTHFEKAEIANPLNINLRPDFSILIYPVITFDSTFAHMGSRERLIGKNASAEMVENFSNEKQVKENTPPAFLVHATDDGAVPVKNSISYYEALIQHKVPAEMHIYNAGGHGFGMINPTTKDRWMESCINWMRSMKIIQ